MVSSILLFALYAVSVNLPQKAGPMVLLNVGEKGSCSGVHIGDGQLLTAAHCENAEKITVTTDRGYTFDTPAKRLAVSKEYDVALFDVLGLSSVKAAPLSCVPMFVGQDVEIAGNPLEWRWVHVWGKVAALPKGPIGPWAETVMLDSTISPGNSGGPVYDMRGRVRGIVVGIFAYNLFGRDVPSRYGFVVPSSAICRLLGRAA